VVLLAIALQPVKFTTGERQIPPLAAAASASVHSATGLCLSAHQSLEEERSARGPGNHPSLWTRRCYGGCRPEKGRAPMPHSSAAQESLAPLTQAVTYPDDLLPELQTMLAALADLEVRYEKDREQLTAWEGPKAAKGRFVAQLEERHQRDREPYVQQLANLHYQIMTLMALQDICSTA
jgi:hypothetical protein